MNVESKYKLIAFAALLKSKQKNSIIFVNDGDVAIAKKLGLSFNTFKKYKNLCIVNDLFVISKCNLQMKSLPKIIKALGLDDVIHKHIRFTSTESLTLRMYYNRILKAILMNNFRQQEFNRCRVIERRNVLVQTMNGHNLGKKEKALFRKLVKESKGNFQTYSKRVIKSVSKNVVSGKNHASALIGMSASTGIRTLKRMDREGDIKRQVISVKSNAPYSFEGYDNLNKTEGKSGVLVPSPSNKCFYISVGSSIILPDSKIEKLKILNTKNFRFSKKSVNNILSPNKRKGKTSK